MRKVTATGQTVHEAVQSAIRQLNIEEDQAVVEVIDEGKKGVLGLFGSKPAIVKVSKEEDPVEKLEKYLRHIIDAFDPDLKLDIKVDQNVVTVDFSGEKIALLIGKRGQTLNALQYLAQLAMHQYSSKYYTVIVDAEGYRERRKETLVALAEKLANRSIKLNRKVKVDPMPSYERKIIHTALQERQDIQTDSEGSEPNRYVVISPI